MTNEELCQELLMSDVVRVDIVPSSGTTLPTPFAVPNLVEMEGQYPNPYPLPKKWDGAVFADSLLTLAVYYDSGIDATIKSNSTFKVTSAREAAGIVRTHTLQMPINRGYQSVRKKEADLQGIDFYLILTTYSGMQYLIYSLPNTSQFSIEEQMGESGTLTVKATVKSMSGVIQLKTT